MSRDREEKIQEDIVKRAIERSHFVQQEEERGLHAQDTLDALQEMTDLPRAELEMIAKEARNAYVHEGEGFFSIGNQILLASMFVLILLGIPILAVWLF